MDENPMSKIDEDIAEAQKRKRRELEAQLLRLEEQEAAAENERNRRAEELKAERELEKAAQELGKIQAAQTLKSTPSPEPKQAPTPTPNPASTRVREVHVMTPAEVKAQEEQEARQFQAMQLAAHQALSPKLERLEMMLDKLTDRLEKGAERGAERGSRKGAKEGVSEGLIEAAESPKVAIAFDKAIKRASIPNKWIAGGVICAMFVLCCGAFFALRNLKQTNAQAIADGHMLLEKAFDKALKKMPKTQIVMVPSTVTSSPVINPDKPKSVVIANYKVSPLKVFEVITEGGKEVNKFICVVSAKTARQISYQGSQTKLQVFGDVGETPPSEDFSDGKLWVWTFDDGEHKEGFKTQDKASLPK